MLSNFFGLVQIGDDDGEEEPSEHRKKHKKSSHHHPHSHRCLIINFSCATFSGNHSACDSDDSFLIKIMMKKICREHFNDRYRVGSDLSSKLPARQVML